MAKVCVLGTKYHGELVESVLLRNEIDSVYRDCFNFKAYLIFIYELFMHKYNVYFFVYAPSKSHHIIFLLFPLIFFRRKVYLEWIGTDVIDLTASALLRKVVKLCTVSLCECEWIQKELNDKGISAELGPYITFSTLFDFKLDRANTELDSNFFMTYSANGRDDFYGVNRLINIFENRPDFDLVVVGSAGEEGRDYPSNIKFLGRVDRKTIFDLYAATNGFIRIPQHDGLSYSVIEALYASVPVAYSYRLEGTHKINRDSDLIEFIERYKNFTLNKEGAEYVVKNYMENATAEKRLLDLISKVYKY